MVVERKIGAISD